MLAGRCRVACHTFGALRTGDRSFSEWYNGAVDDSVVLLNRRDVAGCLPPAFAGYDDGLTGRTVFDFDPLAGSRLLPSSYHDMDTYLDYVTSSCTPTHGNRRGPRSGRSTRTTP